MALLSSPTKSGSKVHSDNNPAGEGLDSGSSACLSFNTSFSLESQQRFALKLGARFTQCRDPTLACVNGYGYETGLLFMLYNWFENLMLRSPRFLPFAFTRGASRSRKCRFERKCGGSDNAGIIAEPCGYNLELLPKGLLATALDGSPNWLKK